MSRKQVVVLLYPGCIPFEVALTAELLSGQYDVVNATPDGEDIPELPGLRLKAELSYSEVDVRKCAAILVPGGDPKAVVENRETDRILREADEANLLLAAICAGPLLLAKAGILKGRTVAHGYQNAQLEFLEPYFVGANLSDALFHADGNILTAKPDAHIEFAVEIACRLGAVDASKSGRVKDYYRGLLGRKTRQLALAILKNRDGKLLLHKAYDSKKAETFYRPLGGGIEFGETGVNAVIREIKEELDLEIIVDGEVSILENIFEYEGVPGHEIVLLYPSKFVDPKCYAIKELDIVESGKIISQAVWRSVQEIQSEGAKLYPLGIEKLVN
ncbi:MAG: DJ-1/PfpI family protein [Bdellovibrionales bacterium]|nr:DJ-1/PfpI family protein [Bdellovibrionales bacterium]